MIDSVGPLSDPGERKDRLRFLVLGRDGHRAALSWREPDAEFGTTAALPAVSVDCSDPDGQGPHPVMPGDRCGGRHVSRVTRPISAAARGRARCFPIKVMGMGWAGLGAATGAVANRGRVASPGLGP
ncbi:hypothetical protein [Streptosporangium roseum]|uniref:hypothetical protein n=1 Tax=Streptosporangium roseum TaxID=2001 RepID=UPI003326A34C